MFNLIGIEFGNLGCKVQQLANVKGKIVSKTSDVEFWFVLSANNGVLYIPVSKIDSQINKCIVPSQIVNSYHEHGRMILRKTAEGTETIPFGGIFVR